MKIIQPDFDEIIVELVRSYNYPLSFENIKAIMGQPMLTHYEITDADVRQSLLRIEKRGEIREEILAIPAREYSNRRYYRMLCPQKRKSIVLN